jgi:hypothetical protein
MNGLISMLFAIQKNDLTNTRNVVVNHFNAPNVLLYIIRPQIYYSNSVCDLPNIQFRTLTISIRELTGEGSNKLKNIIYPIYKDNHHLSAYQELIPYKYIKKETEESLCCNCLRQIREINNDFNGRLACKSCWKDCNRGYYKKLNRLDNI